MKRRSFLQSLFAAVLAPVVAKGTSDPAPAGEARQNHTLAELAREVTGKPYRVEKYRIERQCLDVFRVGISPETAIEVVVDDFERAQSANAFDADWQAVSRALCYLEAA